jgi:hypothetical protein
MSSVSEIFLMHLNASGKISIVQDNANTSFANTSINSLSFCFRGSHSSDSTFWTTVSASRKTVSRRITRTRRRTTTRRRRSSRWEPDTVPISDDQPGIPKRQSSSNELNTDDDDRDNIDACVSPRGSMTPTTATTTTTSVMKTRCIMYPAWEDGTQRDSEPKLPRRQASKRDLSLPRIPLRQNSFLGNFELEGDALVDATHEEHARRIQHRNGTRQVEPFRIAISETAMAA